MNIFRFCLLFVAATSITVTAVIFQPLFIQLLPLYISLVIMLLQTKANRFAYLLGAGNAVLYAISYFTMKLYASALYALLVSALLQVITFIRWNKKAYGNSTELCRLTNKQRLLWLMGGLAAWLVLYLAFSLFGSPYLLLDNSVTIMGIAATIFGMLALIEFQFLQLASNAISCVLYIVMLRDDPSLITYLIYTVYSLVCCAMSAVYMSKLYKKQQEEKRYEIGVG